MDFVEAVQWWEEWQLRILVLVSLFLQYFLFITAGLRRLAIPSWLRFQIWLAYLGSDAIAIYALATLFNFHKKQEWVSTHRSSASLVGLWAPILLIHLGGQDGIAAYNIEDNELWRRHVLTTVSQITVAIYVFRKSWSGGDKRLLQAAILLFVPGILKCLAKPLALKAASITSMADSFGSSLEQYFRDTTKKNTGINSLEDYVRDAVTYVQGGSNSNEEEEDSISFEVCDAHSIFIDLPYPYSVRRMTLKYMVYARDNAHALLQDGLSVTFNRFYTRYASATGCRVCGYNVRSMAVYLPFAAIGLFHKSHREAYNDTDVKITYILLCCTAALEYISYCFIPNPSDILVAITGKPWPDLIAQYNLIGYLARNKRHSRLRGLAFILNFKDLLDRRLWSMKPSNSSSDITELVHDHVTNGWKEFIRDTRTFRAFNDSRGQRTLEREGCGGGKSLLSLSLQRPFDQSVMIWHLATDLCFFHMQGTDSRSDARLSREMSNYMAYLLFRNPEMLMAGANRAIFLDTYREIKRMIDQNPHATGEEELAREIAKKVVGADADGTAGQWFVHPLGRLLVDDALVLAQELMQIGKGSVEGGGKKMWRVIQGVWVEMLCFSAARCRGYLHAKSLGKGGE